MLFITILHLTEAYGTFAIIRPERTRIFQIYFIKTEKVFHQQRFETWINLDVIKMIHSVYGATAIVY